MHQPQPTQTYRHRKHDPAAGHWHEYEVVAVVCPPSENPRSVTNFEITGSFTHTETGIVHRLIGARNGVYSDPPVHEPHVAYINTKEREKRWLRPLRMFVDGRFALVG